MELGLPGRRPGMEQQRALWGLFMHTAVPYGSVWMADDGGAAALWIPPGAAELSHEDEARVEPLLRELVGSRADDLLELLARFDAHHPRHERHHYLSLLGTHPEHRGRGMGMALLSENLAAVDAEGVPAYLESTNPGNLGRYRSVGFEEAGQFTLPADGPTVTTMWREPR